jgi:type IV secretory pathway VirB2 component (pilin)
VATTREAPVSGADQKVGPGTPRPRPTRQMTAQSGAGAGAAASLAVVARGLARLVRLAAWVVAGIIVAGILLVVLKANPNNSIVSAVHDTARALIGPFAGMFHLDHHRVSIAVNWGIAACVYLIAGALVARLITMAGTVGLRRRGAVAS